MTVWAGLGYLQAAKRFFYALVVCGRSFWFGGEELL